jgi:hypothetical protein
LPVQQCFPLPGGDEADNDRPHGAPQLRFQDDHEGSAVDKTGKRYAEGGSQTTQLRHG